MIRCTCISDNAVPFLVVKPLCVSSATSARWVSPRSRASLIREAVDDYLRRHCLESADEAFGLWGKDAVDGLVFQDRARSEW